MVGTNLPVNEISFLERINLVVEGENYAFDDFALKNAQLVMENLLQQYYNRLVILHPTGMLLTNLVCTIIPLALAKNDVENVSRNITDHLHVGDKVQVGGCLGEVNRFTEEYGRQYIVIKFNNMMDFVPFERAWGLQKYEGSAVNLHNFKPKQNKVNKQKAALCDILDLEEEEFPPILFSKTLIVSEKQQYINNIGKLNLNGSSHTSVFPTGYYKDSKHFDRVGSDQLQRRPIICVVSSLQVASAMVETDPSIKVVIVNNLKKLRGNYIYLDRIQSRVTNLVILQEIHKFEEDDIDKLVNMGFNVFHWSKENLKNLNLTFNPAANLRNQIGRSQRTLYSIANPSNNMILIEDDVSNLIKQVDFELKKVRNADFESEYKVQFIARCYDVLLSLRSIPIPLNELFSFSNILDYLGKLSQDLQDLYVNLSFATYGDTLKSIGNAVEVIKNLVQLHCERHPKYGAFTMIDQLGVNDCVVVPKNKHKDIINKWLINRRGLRHGILVLTITEFSSVNRFFSTVLFTGWFGQKHAKVLLTPMATKQQFLLYPYEYEWMERNECWIKNYLKKFSLDDSVEFEGQTTQENDYDLDEYLRKMVSSSQSFYQKLHSKDFDDQGAIVDCYYVEFEEDYYAFLTDGYNCRCLDKDGEIVVKKKVNELQVGDTLIFIKDSSEDVFEKLVKLVESSSPNIREQVILSQLWRVALTDYKDKNGYGYETIQNKLEKAGLKRVATTIKLWLYDETQIGPDDDGIRAIAKLTGNFELESKIEQVMAACSQIRALHVQLGRYLAQSISCSVVGSNLSKEDHMLQKLTQDLSHYALSVIVRAIASEKTTIPSNKVNVLLEK